MEDLRSFIQRLESEGELLRIQEVVDARHIPALVSQSDKAVFFDKVAGFDFPVVSGLLNTRKRIAMSMNAEITQLSWDLRYAMDHLIEPNRVEGGPVQEVVYTGPEVDLSMLPIPLIYKKDGGPYISGGLSCSFDPEYGPNVGIYRLMFRKKDELVINLTSASDLRLYYERSLKRGNPLDISIVIGTHPFEMLAATCGAPLHVDEFAIAGGLYHEPLQLVRCVTNDLFVPANSEIVLEGEITAEGWIYDEGRFGELNRIEAPVSWNPRIKIKAITHRKGAFYYALHMPWENGWLYGLTTEAAALIKLAEQGIEPTAIYATPEGCFHFEIVASVRRESGIPQKVLRTLLSLKPVKSAIVTDTDINIFDRNELGWALALRVQPDQDVIVTSGLPGAESDPSSTTGVSAKKGGRITSKLGIDATIPERLSFNEYEKPTYSFNDRVRLENFAKER